MSYAPPGARWGHLQTITPWHMDSCGIEFMTGANNVGVPTSQTFPTANGALYVPFYVRAPALAQKLFWHNGATAAANISVAIARFSTLQRIVTTGSVDTGTINVVQSVDITDTYLSPDTYYLCLSMSTATDTLMGATGMATDQAKMLGMARQGTAHPIPDPIVPATMNTGRVFVFGVAFRTLIS